MSGEVHFGLKLAARIAQSTISDMWRVADEARFDHCWAFDHLASIGHGRLYSPVSRR